MNYYLDGYSPEEIAVNFPGLSLDKIYATITYYLHNCHEVDAYLSRLIAWREACYQEWLASEPSPLVKRIREIKAQIKKEQLQN
ncbi:MAG: DUF433 domain-containing protein [Okeania sp. SIO2F4]|uniref:DUF433 domain-containing protein n=1 Tax=Okeania sp. SIO2F4 TaxID=2607790 RepID=UPI00142B8DB7|nr:DUF433 domain-containing protein [Okeania sp. SIO2F4]NES02684.1 DUF433 domain-containing protein [Okeania sp. SIO2F4]